MDSDENSVLVIAFDGLDYELIKDFGMDKVMQEEFGKIDNSTDMFSIKTSELFASFITGTNYQDHGVIGIKHWNESRMDRIVNFLEHNFNIKEKRGGYRLKQFLNVFFRSGKSHHTKEYLNTDTLFEKIDNSKSMFVPSYNPEALWGAPEKPLSFYDVEDRPPGFYHDIYLHSRRRREILRPVNRFYDFFMAHIHRADHHHHRYGDPEAVFDKERVERLYTEGFDYLPEIEDEGIEGFAEKIIDFFEESYDYIIFMSDHGLPTKKEHNENAFYSCNRELFPDREPKITEFHDKILELTGKKD